MAINRGTRLLYQLGLRQRQLVQLILQIGGTSVAIIEKQYGHLRDDIALIALAKLALNL